MPNQDQWDIFICHASEDKDAVARPLAKSLISLGLRVWYDETTLQLGNSLRREIDKGLAKAEYGVVILSPAFFAKEWTQRELDGLAAREIGNGTEVILPIWHNIFESEIRKFSPPLADKLGVVFKGDILGAAAQIALKVYKIQSGTKKTNIETSLAEAVQIKDLYQLTKEIEILNRSLFDWSVWSPILVEALAFLLQSENSIASSFALDICAKKRLPQVAASYLVEYIRPYLNSTDLSVVGLAINAVSHMKDLYSVDQLESLAVNHPNPSIKIEALVSLVELAVDKAEDMTLEVLKNGTNDAKVAVLNALKKKNNSFSLRVAETLINDKTASKYVKNTALEILVNKLIYAWGRFEQQFLVTSLTEVTEKLATEEVEKVFDIIYEAGIYTSFEYLERSGAKLAEYLIAHLTHPSANLAKSLGACITFTAHGISSTSRRTRYQAWSKVKNLSIEEFEEFTSYISSQLYYWSPVLEEEVDVVLPLIENRDMPENGIVFLFNMSGVRAAKLVMEWWEKGSDRDFAFLHYFMDHPSKIAVTKLLKFQQNQNQDIELLMAKLSLLKLNRVHVKEVLILIIETNINYKWFLEALLLWIDNKSKAGILILTANEIELLELIRIRKNSE